MNRRAWSKSFSTKVLKKARDDESIELNDLRDEDPKEKKKLFTAEKLEILYTGGESQQLIKNITEWMTTRLVPSQWTQITIGHGGKAREVLRRPNN